MPAYRCSGLSRRRCMVVDASRKLMQLFQNQLLASNLSVHLRTAIIFHFEMGDGVLSLLQQLLDVQSTTTVGNAETLTVGPLIGVSLAFCRVVVQLFGGLLETEGVIMTNSGEWVQ